MIQYNFAALVQTAIIIVIAFLLHYLNIIDYFENTGFSNAVVTLALLYVTILTLGFFEIRGLRGRVYWLPTWFVAALVVALYISTLKGWIFFFNSLAIGSISLFILRTTDKQFRSKFEKCCVNIKKIDKFNIGDLDSRKEFWDIINNSFIFPSKFFLFWYPVFRIVNWGTVRQEDFVDHYLQLTRAIKTEIYDLKDEMEVRKFEVQLELQKIPANTSTKCTRWKILKKSLENIPEK